VDFRVGGYLRLRADAFGGLHLHNGAREGTLVSGIIPPLNKNKLSSAGSVLSDSDKKVDWLGSANMRFRFEPTLLVDEVFSLQAQVDVLDNMVLGSTPGFDVDDPLHPNAFFAESAVSPSAGVTSLDDAIRVKRLWLTWDVFHFLRVEAGRMPFHWGAGMVHNDGNCIDCDRGDTVDRLGFRAGPFRLGSPGLDDLYFSFAWDFPGEGAILANSWSYPLDTGGVSLAGSPAGFFGQPTDGTQVDDVSQYVLVLENRPHSLAGQERAEARLRSGDGPTFHWSWANSFKTQSFAVDLPESVGVGVVCDRRTPASAIYDERLEVPFDCLRLFPRDAFAWLTDLWLKLEWQPSATQRITLELEMAGTLFGELGQASSLRNEDTSKELWGGGALLRAAYQDAGFGVAFETGVASGDPDAPYLGVLDRSNAVAPDAQSTQDLARRIRRDRAYTQFQFNRDYLVDLILFREVIGAVTNAIYVKPQASYDFFDLAGFTFGGRLSLLYAAAMFTEGTPGGGRHLGFETDAQLYVKSGANFLGIIEAGFLVPLDAFDVPTLPSPDPAWTVQARLHLLF
jgi:uncharacterized protein (TIGR04551 family)